MTPVEKAEELFNKFYPRATSYSSDRKNQKDNAKQCALIAVDEMLDFITKYDNHWLDYTYWEEVKNELDNL
jgi:hypothetical protein